MNDYLSKPVELRRLGSAIQDWSGGTRTGAASPLKAPSGDRPAHEPTLDESHLTEIKDLGGNGSNALKELVAILDTSVPDSLRQIEEAFARGSAEETRWAAHHLKASCASVGARRMAELCAAIQARAAAGDVDSAKGLLRELRSEWRLARGAIERFMAAHAST